jgi:hypothetical protein
MRRAVGTTPASRALSAVYPVGLIGARLWLLVGLVVTADSRRPTAR